MLVIYLHTIQQLFSVYEKIVSKQEFSIWDNSSNKVTFGKWEFFESSMEDIINLCIETCYK